MNADYDHRQRPGNWPQRWTSNGLPDWYVELLVGVAGRLTAWREHDPGQHLDPRCDPRCPQRRVERRHDHASGK